MGICLVKGPRLCQMPGDRVMSADRLIEESPAGSRVDPSLFASKYHCLHITSVTVILCHPV